MGSYNKNPYETGNYNKNERSNEQINYNSQELSNDSLKGEEQNSFNAQSTDNQPKDSNFSGENTANNQAENTNTSNPYSSNPYSSNPFASGSGTHEDSSGGGEGVNKNFKTPDQATPKMLGILSLCIGIFSIGLCFTQGISLVAACIGLILGIVSVSREKNGYAVAGIVISSISILVVVLLFALIVGGIIDAFSKF